MNFLYFQENKVCEDKSTKNLYIRNVNYESYFKDIINASQKVIKNIITKSNIKQNIPTDSKLSKIDKKSFFIQYYNPFLWLTSEKMIEISVTRKLKIEDELKFSFDTKTNNNLNTEFANPNKKVINVIAFGKTLNYLLKYILFHINNQITENVVFIFFCDSDSFQNYVDNNNINVDNTIEVYDKLFSNTIKEDNINKFTNNEINILRSISIYFVSSDHYLMKGVGGKRAAIQYYNYTYLSNDDKGNKDKNYKCMTIDDNITAIIKTNNTDCTLRIAEKFDTLDKNCITIGLIDLYNALYDKINNNGYIFAGINKGKGTRQDNSDIGELDSIAIYKLNMSKPVELFNKRYFYNPYFTTFFEDMAFNFYFKNNKQSYKSLKHHLRFGHKTTDPTKTRDYEDEFELDFKKIKIDGIPPIFIMYLLYFICLYDLKDPRFLSIAYDNDYIPYFTFFETQPYKITSNSKYNSYQRIYFAYSVLYCMLNERLDFTLCDPEDKTITDKKYLLYYNVLRILKLYEEKKEERIIDDIGTTSTFILYNVYYIEDHINLLLLNMHNIEGIYNGKLDTNRKNILKDTTTSLIQKVESKKIKKTKLRNDANDTTLQFAEGLKRKRTTDDDDDTPSSLLFDKKRYDAAEFLQQSPKQQSINTTKKQRLLNTIIQSRSVTQTSNSSRQKSNNYSKRSQGGKYKNRKTKKQRI